MTPKRSELPSEDEVPARGLLCSFISARLVLSWMGCFGMAIVYGLKVNLSVTMVAMLNHTAISQQSGNHSIHDEYNATDSDAEVCGESQLHANSTIQTIDGPYAWSEPLQGTLLSCYFWGYLVSQIPCAHVAENFSAKWVMFFSVAINVLCTLLTPISTKLHYVGLIVMRVLEGIGGGASFPAMHCLIAAWVPPKERFALSTIIYMGTSLGTALSILLSGVIAEKFGWESVFYIMGGISCIWLLMWAVLIQDNPNKQRWISPQERQMIVRALGNENTDEAPSKKEHPPVPWKAVFTSVPFWAILIAHCCSNFGWYMFLIEIPFYMKQVLRLPVPIISLMSSLPFFPMMILSVLLALYLDRLKTKKSFSTTVARKTATGICTVIPATCLIVLCYIGCDPLVASITLGIGVIAMGAMFIGFLSNHIDIAPNYAATLVALTNTAATVPGIIVPLFVGYMTKGNQTIEAWRTIFIVTAVLFAIEFVTFTVFGSGEEQKWNKPAEEQSPQREESTPLNASAPSQKA